jgi:hypothetical protein
MACVSDKTADPVCCSADESPCVSGAVADPADLDTDETGPNGLDDDCDGIADEGLDSCVSGITNVTFNSGSSNFDIFSYEASRYDAGSVTAGTISTVACSSGGVIPWTGVSQAEAGAACSLLGGGWELCSAQQWQLACEMGSATQTYYPYGDTYNGTACNGADYGSGELIPSAQDTGCYADYTVDLFDMSGNAEEWTASETSAGSNLYSIRGGSYNDQSGGLTCGFDFWAADPDDFKMDNLGFRCCKGDDPADMPCTPASCNTPPDDVCVAGNTKLRQYDSGDGVCTAGTCEYTYTDIACPQGSGCVDVGGTAYCDRDDRAELWYSVDQILVFINMDEHTGGYTSSSVSDFGDSVGASDPNYLPVGQDCITVLNDGSILGARLDKNTDDSNYSPYHTYFFWIENPPRDGSDVEWHYLGEMANAIMLEGLYTDCAGRIYGMDTGDDDGGSDGNRLIRFNDGLAELKAGTFDIDSFVQVSDLSTASVGDIDDMGPGIDANGAITDNPGYAIDSGHIWDFNYETGSGSEIGSGGSWGIHVLGGDLFVDDISRVYVLNSSAELMEWDPVNDQTSGVLYTGPVTGVSGNAGWSGLAGPLTECSTGFSQ